ncbi:hypothetical protein [Xylophilus sp. ASV27]|uniref:hypothetical protein n=1 Tax=Xylophilus sp. ASV27 TaxID=2795129 RepID=UPI001E5EDFA6|nr:hypothetical protein [Xylophilus sp. ASV27]
MNRCPRFSLFLMDALRRLAWAALPLALLAVAAGPAQAEPRKFPPTLLRGTLLVTYPPAVLMNGREDRLAPGAIIRNTQGSGVLSGTLAGQKLVVNYRRDNLGQILEVWLLTEEEAALPAPGQRSVFQSIFGS